MDALDLAIEDAIWIHRFTGCALEPVGKMRLGFALGFAKLVAQSLVTSQRLQLTQLAKVGHPAVADGVGDGQRERWVRHQQPAAGSDTVCFVSKGFGENFGPILYRYRAPPPCVDCSHALGTIRARDCTNCPARALAYGLLA